MNDWEKAQPPSCPECGEEAFQIINNRCRHCHLAMLARREERMEDLAERRRVKYLLREGAVSLQDLRAGRY